MLEVDGVSAGYGNLQILDDVSLQANPKEVTVIVGPNGSGKSTLLKTIAGLTTIHKGTISNDGEKISGLPPHAIAKRGLAYLPQTESVFTQLKVTENFRMAGYTVAKGSYRSNLEDAMKIFPRLSSYMNSKVSDLSGGERQMVAMTMALVRRPRVVMFDEPTANLSPKLATEVLKVVGSLAREQGLAVVLVEQNARKALEMGDRAYLLVSGKNAFTGTANDLLTHHELARLYLGLKAA